VTVLLAWGAALVRAAGVTGVLFGPWAALAWTGADRLSTYLVSFLLSALAVVIWAAVDASRTVYVRVVGVWFLAAVVVALSIPILGVLAVAVPLLLVALLGAVVRVSKVGP
jgi:hypothetical protein